MNPWMLLLALACAVTLVAALIDWRTGLIPNFLTVPLVAAGIPLHIFAMRALAPSVSTWFWVGDAILGILICSLVPFLLWRNGGMGGGDLKLFAALGALLGVRGGLEIQLVAFTVAALLVPAVLAYRGQLLSVLKNTGRILINPFMPAHKRHTLPSEVLTEVRFGPAIFAAAAFVTCARLWH